MAVHVGDQVVLCFQLGQDLADTGLFLPFSGFQAASFVRVAVSGLYIPRAKTRVLAMLGQRYAGVWDVIVIKQLGNRPGMQVVVIVEKPYGIIFFYHLIFSILWAKKY